MLLRCLQRAKPLVVTPTVVNKGCSRCGKMKQATEFNINKTTSSGLTSHCKARPQPATRSTHFDGLV